MTMILSLLINGDASSGKAALSGLRTDVKATKAETAKLTSETKRATTANGVWARSTTAMRASIGKLHATASGWIAKLREVDNTQKLAAGSVGNLTAQFNDIGVMMAAGQNPLQLAIQQGTQITQVIGPLGAAGAARALGTAFMRLLSPVNLVTLGSIAAGAAIVQWLTRAKDDAETLDDVLERLAGTIDDVKDRAGQSAQSIAEEFGKVSPEITRLLGDLREVGLDQVEADARAAVQALSAGLSEDGQILAAFGRLTPRGSRHSAQSRQVATDITNLGGSESLEDALATVQSIRASMEAAAQANGNWTDEQKALKAELVAVERELRRAVNAQSGFLRASREVGADLVQSAKEYLQTRIAAQSQAQEFLTNLREEKDIRDAIQIHGEDSQRVAELRLAAERRVFEQQVEGRDVSKALKDELMAAWDAANGLAGVNIAGGIAAGAQSAKTLAARLGISLDLAQKLHAMGPQGAPGPQGPNRPSGDGRGDPRTQGGSFNDWQSVDAINFNRTYKPPTKSSGGGGSASQIKTVERLIQQLQRERDLLRETDPLQKELIRIRESLAGATEEQRQTVQDLIAEKIKETRATETQTELTGFLGEVSGTVFGQMRSDASDASDALQDLAVSIGKALALALLLGEGPLGNLLGGSGGGLIGKWLGGGIASSTAAALPALANGGRVRGPGTGTSDDVLMWGSNGEFMINAASTKANLPLLEAINSGVPVLDILKSGQRLQALAAGGMVGSVGARSSVQGAGFGQGTPQLVYIENNSSAPLQAQQETVADGQGRRSQKLVLADAVGAALQTPGGGASRALSRFGVRQRGPKR